MAYPRYGDDENGHPYQHDYTQEGSESPGESRRPEKVVSPYSRGARIRYGAFWFVITALLGISTVFGLMQGLTWQSLFVLVLAVFAGRYAWRIWSWQARHLWWFFIV
jgi:hypothetical protein